jgi:hypothetical protein
MVRAILEGRKTQTRRPIRGATGAFWDHSAWRPVVRDGAITHWKSADGGSTFGPGSPCPRCPYGAPGDRLWVRETWALATDSCTDYCAVQFRADSAIQAFTVPRVIEHYGERRSLSDGWRPSIFMPRWASRIELEIVNVRLERVQQISEADIQAEGAPSDWGCRHTWFSPLWDTINDKRGYPWDRNPWVWVVEFRNTANGRGG